MPVITLRQSRRRCAARRYGAPLRGALALLPCQRASFRALPSPRVSAVTRAACARAMRRRRGRMLYNSPQMPSRYRQVTRRHIITPSMRHRPSLLLPLPLPPSHGIGRGQAGRGLRRLAASRQRSREKVLPPPPRCLPPAYCMFAAAGRW